jgi:hypothetical protein
MNEIKTRLQLLEEMGFKDEGVKSNHDDKWVAVDDIINWINKNDDSNLGELYNLLNGR